MTAVKKVFADGYDRVIFCVDDSGADIGDSNESISTFPYVRHTGEWAHAECVEPKLKDIRDNFDEPYGIAIFQMLGDDAIKQPNFLKEDEAKKYLSAEFHDSWNSCQGMKKQNCSLQVLSEALADSRRGQALASLLHADIVMLSCFSNFLGAVLNFTSYGGDFSARLYCTSDFGNGGIKICKAKVKCQVSYFCVQTWQKSDLNYTSAKGVDCKYEVNQIFTISYFEDSNSDQE